MLPESHFRVRLKRRHHRLYHHADASVTRARPGSNESHCRTQPATIKFANSPRFELREGFLQHEELAIVSCLFRMRVLHVSPSFYPAHVYGGPTQSTYQLCRSLAKLGNEVRVLTTDADGLHTVLDVEKDGDV